jgi:hypothetical protein
MDPQHFGRYSLHNHFQVNDLNHYDFNFTSFFPRKTTQIHYRTTTEKQSSFMSQSQFHVIQEFCKVGIEDVNLCVCTACEMY